MIYPILEVIGLVNRFGTQVVHEGLNMEVREDEVFGIVGGSGTGKSVLLRSILGLQRPQAGIIRIDGRDNCLNRDGLAFGNLDLLQNTRGGRRDFCVHLIG